MPKPTSSLSSPQSLENNRYFWASLIVGKAAASAAVVHYGRTFTLFSDISPLQAATYSLADDVLELILPPPYHFFNPLYVFGAAQALSHAGIISSSWTPEQMFKIQIAQLKGSFLAINAVAIAIFFCA